MPALVGSCEGRSDCGDENFYDVGDWMRLESRIFVAREPEVVGRWLGDVSNVAKWDRGVGDARVTSGGAMKVAYVAAYTTTGGTAGGGGGTTPPPPSGTIRSGHLETKSSSPTLLMSRSGQPPSGRA